MFNVLYIQECQVLLSMMRISINILICLKYFVKYDNVDTVKKLQREVKPLKRSVPINMLKWTQQQYCKYGCKYIVDNLDINKKRVEMFGREMLGVLAIWMVGGGTTAIDGTTKLNSNLFPDEHSRSTRPDYCARCTKQINKWDKAKS